MLSGGSIRSWSFTFEASTVTVHISALAKSVAGSRTKVTGLPDTAAPWSPLVAQAIWNQVSVTFTGSLKVIETLASTATPDAPPAGVVELTAGARSEQFPSGDALFRGDGAVAVKSAGLLSVSRSEERRVGKECRSAW